MSVMRSPALSCAEFWRGTCGTVKVRDFRWVVDILQRGHGGEPLFERRCWSQKHCAFLQADLLQTWTRGWPEVSDLSTGEEDVPDSTPILQPVW